ncbi:MAG TPA: hypothetical protein QGH10_25210, partial [Armatimonadota bacterium]|nr:hypothetical protein [Armatimonadota bacterium]
PTEAAGTEGVHQKIHAIEGLMMDRDPDALYGVMLLQQHVGGEYSDDARRMQRAVMAMRPLDAGHLGQVVNGFLAEGDTERASRWIGYGLAQFQLRPCRTQMGWVAPAICAVARAGELDAAVNHAKDYVSKLRPDERNAAILTLAPAIPNALELLADLPDAPALPGRR